MRCGRMPGSRAVKTREIPSVATMTSVDALPEDAESLKRLLLAREAELAVATAEAAALRAEAADHQALIAHLKLQIEKLRRAQFGQRCLPETKSDSTDDEVRLGLAEQRAGRGTGSADGTANPCLRSMSPVASFPILAAEVVGYSLLMGRDESGTLARLREHRTQRLEPVLARHGGRLVKLTGDGPLIEFASAVNALSATANARSTVDLPSVGPRISDGKSD